MLYVLSYVWVDGLGLGTHAFCWYEACVKHTRSLSEAELIPSFPCPVHLETILTVEFTLS